MVLVTKDLLKARYPTSGLRHWRWYVDDFESDVGWWNPDPFVPTHHIQMFLPNEGTPVRSDYIVLDDPDGDDIQWGFGPQDGLEEAEITQRRPLYGFFEGNWWNFENLRFEYRKSRLLIREVSLIKNSPETNLKQGFVYFIQAGKEGPIKIGWSENIAERIKQLQTGNAMPLRLLGKIEAMRSFETEMHKRFADTRMASEWFTPSQPLFDFINKFCSK